MMKNRQFMIFQLSTIISCATFKYFIRDYGKISRSLKDAMITTNDGTLCYEPDGFGRNFKLPPFPSNPLLLETKNPHNFDKELVFDQNSHSYFIRGERMKYSVTQLVQSFFEKFEPNQAVDRMINSKNWPRPGYCYPDGSPLSKNDIIKMWEANSLEARNRGTWMHYNIERALNCLPVFTDIVELRQFDNFREEVLIKQSILPFRTEWRIAAPNLGIAGSVDFIGKMTDNSYILMDWKRSKNLSSDIYLSYGKMARFPLEHLRDCDGTKYGLQLNFYKFILQRYYGLNVSKLAVVSFHPSQKSYFFHEIRDYSAEIELIIKYNCHNDGNLHL